MQAKLARLQTESADGTLSSPSSMTTAEYLHFWLENYAKPTCSTSTYETYRRNIENHIIPQIGAVKLTKLASMHVLALMAKLDDTQVHNQPRKVSVAKRKRPPKPPSSKKLSPGTRVVILATLRNALSQAVRLNLLKVDPSAAVDRPKGVEKEIKTLSEDQVKRFLQQGVTDRLYPLHVVAVYSGARQGELIALGWPDIDFEHSRITIRRTMSQTNAGQIVKEPKTKKGKRIIEMPAEAMQALHDHRVKMLAEGNAGSQFVFCGEKGDMLYRGKVTWWFKRTLKNAGLPPIRFHDLRHTHASLLLRAGVHPKVVQERLGHATIAITLDTYSHLMPSMQGEVSNKLSKLLG